MKLQILAMIFVLMSSATAFSIISPTEQTYDGGANLIIFHNTTLDNITYELNDVEYLACTNCSTHQEFLNLSNGNYTLTAYGTTGNDTLTDSVSFVVADTILSICDHNGDGKRDLVDVALFAEIKDDFDVNNDGVSDLVDFGLYGMNNQNNTWCKLKFYPDPEFNFEIEKPDNKEYHGLVPVYIDANKDLDKISYAVAGLSEDCEDCDTLEDELNLSEGNYTLTATGKLGNTTKTLSVNFSVVYEDSDDDDDDNHTPVYNRTRNRTENESGEPRFDTGFEKLPQMVAAGEISDEELTEIILNNELNPGIINRLIKTGKLGNESIEAILDTQFKPQGIFNKLLGFFGVKQETYASEIYEQYQLSEKNQQKILGRTDLPNNYKEEVKTKLKEKTVNKKQDAQLREENQVRTNNGQEKKTYVVASQNTDVTPPGQQKKEERTTGKPDKVTGKATKGNAKNK